MSYRISATFPSDRDKHGTLELYDSSDTLIFGPVPALGRGSNKPENGHDHRLWKLKNADTPTGEYEASIIEASPDVSTYGPYQRVMLYPAIMGNAKIAEDNGRKDILIHGGDPETDSSKEWYPLKATYGCIRVSNEDQKKLIEAIVVSGGGSGKVMITDV
ncbi:L,D-transpeptidase [Paenibacillus glacialis]|uniref:L,D-TPase catalytic domain-containing protein n=1 Tax=Paenibacillus glacialis TaxID=494026 RepID=A0A168C3F1_9BACL|nr:L,D-transpeptidase [Paenibacillus glacialis]OAB33011.1 hypothetical protein PGLA_26390 [Paenibacillus glacialis]